MKTKEFLEENYKLRRELDKIKAKHVKEIINLLQLLKDSPKGLDLDKAIEGFKQELERLK